MRIAYLDCFAGIAGDMMLGALLDAGVPQHVLDNATAALNIGASLRVERVDRSGITATKVHVMENGHLAEDGPTHTGLPDQHTHQHSHAPKTQHLHKTGHAHHHHDHDHEPHHEASSLAHPHVHGRSLSQIKTLISAAPLNDAVKTLSLRAFQFLGEAEARIHNVPVEEIHFHEVGAVDAIVDIVASCAGVVHLNVGAWYCSAVNTGSGMVHCAHGDYPVPAPATADLLREVPTYAAHLAKELTTPTGAALIRALAPTFGTQPAMKVERIGYGAGTRNPQGFPNVLRLRVGESFAASHERGTDTVTVMETALDDLSPQVIAYVSEQALALGALDVMLTPVQMKKGRPGTLLTVLAKHNDVGALEQMLFRETTTLGIRVREEKRVVLEREIATVNTQYGPIRVKTARDAQSQEQRNVAPEFEDCKAAAERAQVPLKVVQQAALAAYFEGKR